MLDKDTGVTWVILQLLSLLSEYYTGWRLEVYSRSLSLFCPASIYLPSYNSMLVPQEDNLFPDLRPELQVGLTVLQSSWVSRWSCLGMKSIIFPTETQWLFQEWTSDLVRTNETHRSVCLDSDCSRVNRNCCQPSCHHAEPVDKACECSEQGWHHLWSWLQARKHSWSFS